MLLHHVIYQIVFSQRQKWCGAAGSRKKWGGGEGKSSVTQSGHTHAPVHMQMYCSWEHSGQRSTNRSVAFLEMVLLWDNALAHCQDLLLIFI